MEHGFVDNHIPYQGKKKQPNKGGHESNHNYFSVCRAAAFHGLPIWRNAWIQVPVPGREAMQQLVNQLRQLEYAVQDIENFSYPI
jgi:hypothetical protein